MMTLHDGLAYDDNNEMIYEDSAERTNDEQFNEEMDEYEADHHHHR